MPNIFTKTTKIDKTVYNKSKYVVFNGQTKGYYIYGYIMKDGSVILSFGTRSMTLKDIKIKSGNKQSMATELMQVRYFFLNRK